MGLFSLFSKKEDEIIEPTIRRSANFSSFNIVTDYIYEKSGITELDKRALTASRLQQYAISVAIYTSHDFLDNMKKDTLFYQEVLNIATVNETFFFRELKELEWLVEYIKKSSKTLQILSMPCSSGEEIYSILILMQENGIDLKRVKITGYDINSHAVTNAQEAKYEEHSLHKLSENMRNKYFIKTQNTYQVSQNMREHVTIQQKNIFDLKDANEKFDVVLSRNMFIYFNDEKRALALDIIVNLLHEGGIYIKGHADYIKKHDQLSNTSYGIYTKTIV